MRKRILYLGLALITITMMIAGCGPAPQVLPKSTIGPTPTRRTEQPRIFNRRLQIWDIESGQLETQLDFPMGTHYALSPDGRTVAFGCEEVHVQSVHDGREMVTIVAPTGYASISSGLRFTADSQLLVVPWKDEGSQENRLVYMLDGKPASLPEDFFLPTYFSPDGRWGVYLGREDWPQAHVVDMSNGQEVFSTSTKNNDVKGWTISADGNTFAAIFHFAVPFHQNCVNIWDLESKKWTGGFCCLWNGRDFARTVYLSWDGRVAVIDNSVWDLQTGELIGEIEGPDGTSWQFSSQAKTTLAKWDGSKIQEFESYDPRVWHATRQVGSNRSLQIVNPEGMLAQLTIEEVEVWDMLQGKLLLTFPVHGQMWFVADGKKLALLFLPPPEERQ